MIKKMILDSFFTIGKSHKVCQDYIIHGGCSSPYIILGDGCSSSSNTDIGSRLLVQSALKIIKNPLFCGIEIPEADTFGIEVIKNAIIAKNYLCVSGDCLDSTLMVLSQYSNTNRVRLLMYGDGLVITKQKKFNIDIFKVSYDGEMPFYLSYLLSERRKEIYDKKAKEFEPNGNIINCCSSSDNFEGHKHHYNLFHSYDFLISDLYDFIIISSDGLGSFYKQETGEKIPLGDVVKELCSFKSFKGEFLKRRMNKMLKNYEKQGIYHYDDLSVGVMYNDNQL